MDIFIAALTMRRNIDAQTERFCAARGLDPSSLPNCDHVDADELTGAILTAVFEDGEARAAKRQLELAGGGAVADRERGGGLVVDTSVMVDADDTAAAAAHGTDVDMLHAAAGAQPASAEPISMTAWAASNDALMADTCDEIPRAEYLGNAAMRAADESDGKAASGRHDSSQSICTWAKQEVCVCALQVRAECALMAMLAYRDWCTVMARTL